MIVSDIEKVHVNGVCMYVGMIALDASYKRGSIQGGSRVLGFRLVAGGGGGNKVVVKVVVE